MEEQSTLSEQAIARVRAANADGKDFTVHNIYRHILDGPLVEVGFMSPKGWAINHVRFGKQDEIYRAFNEVCRAIDMHKERSFFFRLLTFTGVGGLIALFLISVFSVLFCILALSDTAPNSSVVEVIKLSFAIILGFYFGSQSRPESK